MSCLQRLNKNNNGNKITTFCSLLESGSPVLHLCGRASPSPYRPLYLLWTKSQNNCRPEVVLEVSDRLAECYLKWKCFLGWLDRQVSPSELKAFWDVWLKVFQRSTSGYFGENIFWTINFHFLIKTDLNFTSETYIDMKFVNISV